MRYRHHAGLLAIGAFLLMACASEDDADAPPEEIAETEGQQSRDPGTPEVVARDLEVPWGIDFLPDGDALVTERDSGRVLRVGADGVTQEVDTIDDVHAEGEGGLMGIAISPQFTSDGGVYLYYTTQDDNRVVRTSYDEDDGLGDLEVILDGIPSAANHNGGRIAFGPDDALYVATGDAGDAALAQDESSLGGKILRVDLDGAPAAGNPFDSEVYTLGHRNVQGLAWNEDALFATEFGADADDEVNMPEPGGNYGWPDVAGAAGDPEFIDPVITWEDVSEASPSGAAVAGDALWVAALRGERLWRAPLAGEAGAPGEPEDFFHGEYGRLRTVVPTPEGNALWVATSNTDGRGDPSDEDDVILRVPLN